MIKRMPVGRTRCPQTSGPNRTDTAGADLGVRQRRSSHPSDPSRAAGLESRRWKSQATTLAALREVLRAPAQAADDPSPRPDTVSAVSSKTCPAGIWASISLPAYRTLNGLPNRDSMRARTNSE